MSLLERLLAWIKGLKPKGNIVQRTVKSAGWLLGQNVVVRVLAVLARLVGPAEFGLFGIALLTLSASKKFSNIGLKKAFIQKTDKNVDSHLNTTWMLEVGRGGLIASLLFAVALPVGEWFFDEPRAVEIIRVIGLSTPLLGFRNPGIVYFQKNPEFYKQFAYKIGGDSAHFIVGVGYALVNPTAWAFVFGFLAADVVKLVLSYVIHGYRLFPSFDLDIAKGLIRYGKWITRSSILFFIYSEGDDALVGWFLTPTALAYYQYTYRFSNAPATELSQVITRVMLPAYSKLQTDEEELRGAFLRTLCVTALVSFPSAIGIAAIAPESVVGGLRRGVGTGGTGHASPRILRAFRRARQDVRSDPGSYRPSRLRHETVCPPCGSDRRLYPPDDQHARQRRNSTQRDRYLHVPDDAARHLRDVLFHRPPDARNLLRVRVPVIASVTMGLTIWYLGTVSPFSPLVNLAALIPAGVVVFVALARILELMTNWTARDNFE
ncbi:MAG: oligosaccharide flippase family protein [Halobacteriota archaeon]